MNPIKITKIFMLGVLASIATHAYSIDEISYKGVKFGITENEFSKKFKADNFKCAIHLIGIGKQCESKSATYADMAAEKTAAWFVKDQLISVSIDFTNGDKNPFTSSALYSMILNSLQERYGREYEFSKTKKDEGFLESYKWDDERGQKVILTNNTSAFMGTLINVHIFSDKGMALYKSESETRARLNKIRRNNDM